MMENNSKNCMLKLIGRVLMSIIFLVAGYGKIVGFAGTVAFVGTALPFPALMTIIAIIIEVVGGLMLLFGYKTKLAAIALGFFALVAGFAFHFNLTDQAQSVHLMKNLAIVGGMLYVVTAGAGRYSLDAKMEKKAAATPAA